MHDPEEGVTPDGLIRTGARHRPLADGHVAVLDAATGAVADDVAVYLYGSVATGTASIPSSDVDLLTLGLPPDAAAALSSSLSRRFRPVCREVAIAPASFGDLHGLGPAAYGLQVFLRHYCVHLAGPDPAADLPPAFPADARAARGFNGDIAQHAQRWRQQAGRDDVDVARFGTRVARTSLLALAGIVSVRLGTWTTDRRGAAARWAALEPGTDVDGLVEWLDRPPHDRTTVAQALDGPVRRVTEVFATEIGLW